MLFFILPEFSYSMFQAGKERVSIKGKDSEILQLPASIKRKGGQSGYEYGWAACLCWEGDVCLKVQPDQLFLIQRTECLPSKPVNPFATLLSFAFSEMR